MKKINLRFFSIILLAAGILSCTKTTKGKVSNDWKVSAYESTTQHTMGDGSISISEYNSDGPVYNEAVNFTSGEGVLSVFTSTGKVEKDDFTINKDGTWTWNKQTSYSVGQLLVTKEVITSKKSGTWNFIGKARSEDFRKNERIIFNTLRNEESLKETYTVAATGEVSIGKDSQETITFLPGEKIFLFTVLESKKKELQLSAKDETVFTQNGGSMKSITSSKWTLTQE